MTGVCWSPEAATPELPCACVPRGMEHDTSHSGDLGSSQREEKEEAVATGGATEPVPGLLVVFEGSRGGRSRGVDSSKDAALLSKGPFWLDGGEESSCAQSCLRRGTEPVGDETLVGACKESEDEGRRTTPSAGEEAMRTGEPLAERTGEPLAEQVALSGEHFGEDERTGEPLAEQFSPDAARDGREAMSKRTCGMP